MIALTISRATRCALLGSFLIGASLHAAPSTWKVSPLKAGKAKNPIAPEGRAASAEEGRVLYDKECASCHGKAGKGDGPGAAQLTKPATDLTAPDMGKQSDGELFVKITQGRRPMPSYEKTLTDDQRWHVVNFLRVLAPESK